jgi:hypothetical protein
MKPVYRSEIVLARASDDFGLNGLSGAASGLGGLASLAGISLGPKDGAAAESMGLLRSKALLVTLVEQKQLLPVLFAERVDPETGSWKAEATAPTMGDALLLFDGSIREIREDVKTGLVTVRVDWTDRHVAAEWAAALVDLANEELRRRAIAESDAALTLLREEWNKSDSISVRDALARLIEAQLKSRTIASIRHDYAFKVVDPARVSDPDKRVKPARTVMAIAAAAAGFVLAAIIVLFQPVVSAHFSTAGRGALVVVRTPSGVYGGHPADRE